MIRGSEAAAAGRVAAATKLHTNASVDNAAKRGNDMASPSPKLLGGQHHDLGRVALMGRD
jgi:hypothetical protein